MPDNITERGRLRRALEENEALFETGDAAEGEAVWLTVVILRANVSGVERYLSSA